jgi:hypothetical protein
MVLTVSKGRTGVPPYLRVILSKTCRGYVMQRIIPNALQWTSVHELNSFLEAVREPKCS